MSCIDLIRDCFVQLFVPCIDLMNRSLTVYNMDSPVDYRLLVRSSLLSHTPHSFFSQGRHGSPCFLTPISSETTAQLDSLWREVAGGEVYEDHLEMLGRRVKIPAVGNGLLI